MSLSTTIKAIQDTMRKDAGVDGDAQRIGQLGWMIFFKIFSDLEIETELEDDTYESPVPPHLRWNAWANEDLVGTDAPTGNELLDLVDNSLFPIFKDLNVAEHTGKARQRAELLRSVFEDAYNYMKSGTLMRQVINKINHDIDFNESKTRHTFGDIYEQILKDLQSAGNAGEFYTPRAATHFAVDMVNPQFGEVVLDPACGTGGFLTCAFENMRPQANTSAKLAKLKVDIHGVEKKALPHLLCVTNLMVHGIEVPEVRHGNTLARPLRDYGRSDQVDVIVTNPPFGGIEEDGIENNFPTEFRTRETADLFLVLVMELLKDGGRAAIILPDGTLFGEGIKTRIKKRLLEECNLHTIVRLPKGVFGPYTTIKTNILFFTKGEPTKDVWFYEHPYPEGYRSYSKTKPMRVEEFEPEKDWWVSREETDRAWKVAAEDIAADGYNLDIVNPNVVEDGHEDPDVLLARFAQATNEVEAARDALRSSLAGALLQGLDALVEAEIPDDLHLAWDRVSANWRAITDHAGAITEIRQAILQLAIRGRLVSQDEADGSAGPELVRARGIKASMLHLRKQASLPSVETSSRSLPSGWTWATVDDLFLVTGGIQKSSRRRPRENHWPYLRVANVQRGRLDLKEVERFELFDGELDRLRLEPGDLLVVEGNGSESEIGRCARWNGEIDDCVHQNHLIRCRPMLSGVEHYVLLFLNSPTGMMMMKNLSVTTSGLYNLSVSKIRSIRLPLPPLAEQVRIRRRANELMRLCDRLVGRLDVQERGRELLAASSIDALLDAAPYHQGHERKQ